MKKSIRLWLILFTVLTLSMCSFPVDALGGNISISSTPSGVAIYLDGSKKGTTPFNILQVSPGSHTIKLTLSQYDDWTTTINVMEGITNTVSATLSKKGSTQNPTPTVITPIITPTYTTKIPSPTPIINDITSPSISLSKQIVDFNDNGQLEEGEKLDIIYGANDESGVKSIKVLLDGTQIDLRNTQGTFHIITDSLSMGDHSISVEAIDSKGNKKSEEMKVNVARAGPSVYFPKSKFKVTEGEDFRVDLSAINPIGNPNMTVQLILKPQSSVYISGSDCESVKGMCKSSYPIGSEDGVRGVSVNMRGDRAGEYPIQAEVYYQFENGSRSPPRYETFTLVVEPKQTLSPTPTPAPTSTPHIPGFEAIISMIGLFLISFLRKK